MATTTRTNRLEVIDRFLLSDRAPDNSMGLSDLDGFLTGIAIGPELIMPSEWLPMIWGGDHPNFRNAKQAQEVMSAIMERYNEIVRGFQERPVSFDPVFWKTKDGLVIAADWAEGFNDAMDLRVAAWKPLFADKQASKNLKAIFALCGTEHNAHQLSSVEKSEAMRRATDELSASIIAIHKFWDSQRPLR